jgi:hypothetical protein
MHIAACSNSGVVIRALIKAGGNARDNRAYKGRCSKQHEGGFTAAHHVS